MGAERLLGVGRAPSLENGRFFGELLEAVRLEMTCHAAERARIAVEHEGTRRISQVGLGRRNHGRGLHGCCCQALLHRLLCRLLHRRRHRLRLGERLRSGLRVSASTQVEMGITHSHVKAIWLPAVEHSFSSLSWERRSRKASFISTRIIKMNGIIKMKIVVV